MDAPEEDLDIKLQKISGDLIGEVDKALPKLLRKRDGTVRSVVRWRDFGKLTSTYLDPFQELPQLLDPHLPKWLPMLAEAFLEHLQSSRRISPAASTAGSKSQFLLSIRTAICKTVYTICKIRGEKVVARFLNVETRYLELLLSALEESESPGVDEEGGSKDAEAAGIHDAGDGITESSWTKAGKWTWEERYVVLLWLSQLFFAPFDLSTISSVDVEDEDVPKIPGFQWPPNVPSIATRILPFALKYISVPGKERDAAKAVLVRIAMRKDMQEIGILESLIRWALQCLTPGKDKPAQLPYHYIGVLSFLAGILASSAGTSDLDKYLPKIFATTIATTTGKNATSEAIQSSAVARKTAIKVIRAVAIQTITSCPVDLAGDNERMDVVETTIDHLLTHLADNDTPVRLAASKALSMITLKLDPELASEVVETVLESLSRNVFFSRTKLDSNGGPTRDISAVDPLEWHGLMLTLAHLLYRRSPPAAHLPEIIYALLTGLAFERRSTTGGSIGANVRDAACFGVWALARRYTTEELLAVPTPKTMDTQTVTQVLATHLIVAASLDPAGNIRRGSSAALQELIGRHPNTVAHGIWVVQAVDYHGVALRSRAVGEVAVAATKLHGIYGRALLRALMGWRGVGDGDAAARRGAGAAVGKILGALAEKLTFEEKVKLFSETVDMLEKKLAALQARQVEERHGLLLSFAAVIDEFPGLVEYGSQDDDIVQECVDKVIMAAGQILEKDRTTTFRKPELVDEAASRLFVSLFPIIQVKIDPPQCMWEKGSYFISGTYNPLFKDIVAAFDSVSYNHDEALASLITTVHRCLDDWLARPEQEVIDAASHAGLILLLFSSDSGRYSRSSVTKAWAREVSQGANSRTGTGFGYFFALATAAPMIAHMAGTTDADADKGGEEKLSLILNSISDRWSTDTRIETRVALLQALTQSGFLRMRFRVDSAATSQTVFDIIAKGLDDYTTNARGDVGSLVRLQAIRASMAIWEAIKNPKEFPDFPVADNLASLFRRILRLAAEKLDRVRVEAHRAIVMILHPDPAIPCHLRSTTFSSEDYFSELLRIPRMPQLLYPILTGSLIHSLRHDPHVITPASLADASTYVNTAATWTAELLSGLVSSADTGNEDLVIASRAALARHMATVEGQNYTKPRDEACLALVANLKHEAGDRVIVPTLEVIAYLFHVGVWQCCERAMIVGEGSERTIKPAPTSYKNLCAAVQRAGYKTGNVRKLEACVRVYGAIAATADLGLDRDEAGKPVYEYKNQEADAAGVAEARKRLGALLYHPWPRIRSLVVDEMWSLLALPVGAGRKGTVDERAVSLAEKLKGMDWGKAGKAAVKELVEELGFV